MMTRAVSTVMRMTTLRQRFGYLTGINAAVPMFVAEEIDAEVNRRRAAGRRGHAGKSPVVGDVVREVLISWARAVRAARESVPEAVHGRAKPAPPNAPPAHPARPRG